MIKTFCFSVRKVFAGFLTENRCPYLINAPELVSFHKNLCYINLLFSGGVNHDNLFRHV